jgi:3-oxoadipate enol-lactonase
VFRYDRRGFGNSAPATGPFSHHRDLYRLLEFLGIERTHLLGCSMSGATVLDLSLEHPEMAVSLIMVSSALGGYCVEGDMPQPLQELAAALQAQDSGRAADLAVRIRIDGPRRTPDQVDARIRERGREMALATLPNAFVQKEPLKPLAVERFHEVAAPTLTIVGELDDAGIANIGDLLTSQVAGD